MAVRNNVQKQYMRYAEHCLKMAQFAPDQKSRRLQRAMANEWLKLAEAEPSQLSQVHSARSNGEDRHTSSGIVSVSLNR